MLHNWLKKIIIIINRMVLVVLTLILISTAVSCAPTSGYTRIWLPTYPRTELNVRIVEYYSLEELQTQYWLANKGEGDLVYAFSRWSDSGWCEIHVMVITQKDWQAQLTLRAHELMHCTHGRWHD